ncbi:MAG: tRNA guanosine(15) transglycosylase TgtA [Candidatus Lokiarchaeota archaeon]|nr:tRNA guanosine(15) transglycosylase TgtA [Candidatus Harpocratesius repetitus]
MSYSYEIRDFDAAGRIGRFKLGSKVLDTPNLFPVVSPFANLISPKDLFERFKAQSIFTNAYILYKNQDKNQEILDKGLHKHLEFPGIIATDSGAFQDYMYAGAVKVKPEEIEPFQEQIGSDCPVILDIPVQTTDSLEEAERKINITLQRARENIARRIRKDTAWFGPIHGSIYPQLLKKSAIEMSKLDFGIYAIGGVVKTFIDYRFDLDVAILLEVKKWLRADRPLHMFGLGLPAFFSLAVACGADLFDSAAYILYAKDERYFTLTGTKNLKDLHEFPCHCPVCTSYTVNELRKEDKATRIKAIAEHNLFHSFSEIRTIRNAIKEGTLWDLVEQRVHAHPKFVKALNIVKKNPENFLNLLNLNQSRGQMILSSFSLYRAHFHRFRNKVANYRIPEIKNHLFLIPELNLPSIQSRSVKNWIKTLKQRIDWKSTQICIVSNVLGLIPLEFAEIYPASQHEGTLNPIHNLEVREVLMKSIIPFLKKNLQDNMTISILIPDVFINEYNEIEEFSSDTHLISLFDDIITTHFPSIKISILNEIRMK